jgi:hypothetical protein
MKNQLSRGKKKMRKVTNLYLQYLVNETMAFGSYMSDYDWTRPPAIFKEIAKELFEAIQYIFEREKRRIEKEVVAWIPTEPKED